MSTADRIRFFRVRAGKSTQEMSLGLGLNDAWYRDLELHDDELKSTLTLFQALQLASLLGVRLEELVADAAPAVGKIELLNVPSMIMVHIARKGMSIEQFEEHVGWELKAFLESPVKVAAELPIAFLQELSDALGIHWLSLLPEADVH